MTSYDINSYYHIFITKVHVITCYLFTAASRPMERTTDRLLVLLVTWYPGDETIRASSESPLRFMFSRSGISFGNRISVHFSTNVRLEAGERAIQKTKREYTVQGTIAKHPTWHAHLNVTREAEQTLEPPKPIGKGLTCFL